MLGIAYDQLARDLMQRLDRLALYSECSTQLTRRYLTPQHRGAIGQLSSWMSDAGMSVRLDEAANLVGRLEGRQPDLPALMLGSHIDTVPDGGRYDGALGIVLPLVCATYLQRAGWQPCYPLEVTAFGDEEGARFQSTYLGSRAMAGTLDRAVLEASDSDGISLRGALRDFGLAPERLAHAARRPGELAAYVEVHIEQGPVLEAEDLPVGIVSAIAGATRLAITVSGAAGHAGTVPMALRKDALAAAAEVILFIEQYCATEGLVGTVGQLAVAPGAVNVIPGAATFSVDIRAGDDAAREQAVNTIRATLEPIAARRGVSFDVRQTHSARSVACDQRLSARLAGAVRACGHPVKHLPSGAGHDAAAMAALVPSAMLFVRCAKGISHHPDEAISGADAAAAARVLIHFLCHFDPRHIGDWAST
ncbi:MAG: allantoate amidohydrolase [Gammaproteobacteria bacterium]|nr:allantoate amidohydrolase [Gammaproteobacteria bacterium]